MSGCLRVPRLTSRWMRAALAPALIFMATATDRQYLTDFWHHLVRGRAMAAAGRVLAPDLSTFTVPVRPFHDSNWLTQIVYYHLFGLGGLPLVQFVNALALAGMMLWFVCLCRRVAGSWGVAGVAGIFLFFGLWQALTIRPQTFSFLLFVALYDLLENARRRRWLLALPPALIALWANLHGAFPIGLWLMGLYAVAAVVEQWPSHRWRFWQDPYARALALSLAASVPAVFANPFGLGILDFVGTTVSSSTARGIDEWVRPDLTELIGQAWVASLVLAGVAFAFGRPCLSVREAVLTLGFLPVAYGSARMVPWWFLVVTPLLARRLADFLARSRRPAEPEVPAVGPAVCFGAIVFMALISVPGLNRYNPLLGPARQAAGHTQADLEAVADHLKTHAPEARLFCRFEWAEYLTWSVGPRVKVFMDGWIDTFPDRVWDEYRSVTTGLDGWEAILNDYRVEYLLVDRAYHRRTGLLDRVEGAAGWERSFAVGDAVLYVRRPTAPVAFEVGCAVRTVEPRIQ